MHLCFMDRSRRGHLRHNTAALSCLPIIAHRNHKRPLLKTPAHLPEAPTAARIFCVSVSNSA